MGRGRGAGRGRGPGEEPRAGEGGPARFFNIFSGSFFLFLFLFLSFALFFFLSFFCTFLPLIWSVVRAIPLLPSG